MALGVLLSSCSKKDKDIDFYKSQYRDPLFFGKWKLQSSYSSEQIREFKSDGSIVDYYDNFKQKGPYYYTVANHLFTYENLGKFTIFKTKDRYEIKSDTLRLYYYDEALKEYLDRPTIYVRVKGVKPKKE